MESAPGLDYGNQVAEHAVRLLRLTLKDHSDSETYTTALVATVSRRESDPFGTLRGS